MKKIDIQKFIADIQNSSGYWEEMTVMDFAVMLDDEMQKQGISKSQLAKKAGVSKAYISKVLGGNKANFTLKSMAKLLFAMGKKLCLSCRNLDEEEENPSDEIYSWTTPESQIQGDPNVLEVSALQTPLTENVLTIQNSVKSKDSSAYKGQVAA